MIKDREFQFAFFVSLVFHVGLLANLSYSNVPKKMPQLKQLEVTYKAEEPKPAKKARKIDQLKRVENSKLSKNTKGLIKDRSLDSHLIKTKTSPVHKIALHKKQPLKMPNFTTKHRVSVPMLKSEKITNSKYLTYHESIREKIRERAYLYVNDRDFDAGKVYLTFALLADGSLKEIKIIEGQTQANDFIRGVGLRSIKESTPFKPFPKDLDFPELSFNVVISFEIDP